MLAKVVIVIAMLIILGSLASSLVFLIRDKGKTKRGVIALTLRIGISLFLFVFLFLAFKFHWLVPHDLNPGI